MATLRPVVAYVRAVVKQNSMYAHIYNFPILLNAKEPLAALLLLLLPAE